MMKLLLCSALVLSWASSAQSSPLFEEPKPPNKNEFSSSSPALRTKEEILQPVIKAELLRLVPTLLVKDLARAQEFYTQKLGFQVQLSTPSYVAVGRDGVQIGLALDKSRSPQAGMSCYINVNGVDALHREYLERKVPFARGLATQDSRMREFMVLDPDKNTIIFGEFIPAP